MWRIVFKGFDSFYNLNVTHRLIVIRISIIGTKTIHSSGHSAVEEDEEELAHQNDQIEDGKDLPQSDRLIFFPKPKTQRQLLADRL